MTFYRFARAVAFSLCKVVFRVHITGIENVPTAGAYIVAPTHRSILDVPFAAFITRRTICFLTKSELFANPVLCRLFTTLGAVRVERGTADRGALRALESVLREGSPVAVFPEGTRGSGPAITPLFDGAAFLALKLGVPIIPVGIGGSEGILPKGKVLPRICRVAVVVGEPIVPPALDSRARRAAATRLTGELRDELQRSFSDALRLAGAR
ncbi:MAG TPA: lysophospholipid acyltransferase family protein [Acidimicrobiia bacterium]